MKEEVILELSGISIGQTHQSRPRSMVFPQFTKIPVTLVFNKTNCLIINNRNEPQITCIK